MKGDSCVDMDMREKIKRLPGVIRMGLMTLEKETEKKNKEVLKRT